MTDSMNFGPEWLRNLSSDGSTTSVPGVGARYQLSEYRYGREEMLGLYEKGFKPPLSLSNFAALYSELPLVPLVFSSSSDEERIWPSNRPPPMGPSVRGGRGTSLERGGRIGRGRGSYQPYGRNVGYETGGNWGGNGEQSDWSPRKEYNYRSSSVDNWRRNRCDEEDGWRSNNQSRGPSEKWGRSQSWRDGDKDEERGQQTRTSWHEGSRGHQRRVWMDDRDHLPEWATENLGEGGGTFDSTGAYHGSDEEVEQKGPPQNKKEPPLQKSASQQNISTKQQSPTLPSSKSVTSLSKHVSISKANEEVLLEKQTDIDRHEALNENDDPPDEEKLDNRNSSPQNKSKSKHETVEIDVPSKKMNISNGNLNINGIVQDSNTNRVEEDFDRLQEDLVLKLVVEEELPKPTQMNNMPLAMTGAPQPPPNLPPARVDKWFYQDPQGHLQGPFAASEMADWYKAGYFTSGLLVRRQFDKGFYSLGDLVHACKGNPFLMNVRLPVLNDTTTKLSDQDVLQYQYLQTQLALRNAATARIFNQGEWSGIPGIQPRDHISQHILSQQIPPELQFLQASQSIPNPLLQMINQMQQVNKLPGQTIPEKPQNSMPVQLDPIQSLVQQMGGLQSLQTRIQPVNATIGLPPNMQNENMTSNLSGLHSALPPSANMTGIPAGMTAPGILPGSVPQKPTVLDSLSSNDNNPINNLLRQFQNKQSQQIDSLWQQNQYVPPPTQNTQWQQPPPEVPLSMWDIQQTVPPNISSVTPSPEAVPENVQDSGTVENERVKEIKEISTKEEKKKRELEEKQAKKEAEEKRKQEQRKQEIEKKAAEDKRKKEEERLRKELEKAKKEAEEKRLRELEEKRRLKEQRKAEEDARKKAEEQKKEKQERDLQEMIEMARRQKETVKVKSENATVKIAKVTPWCQSHTNAEPSLVEIQKAEREKRAEQALLQQRTQQQQQQAQEQSNAEKSTTTLFSWAKKPIMQRQVKSLAEIQAEEQERLLKEAADQRMAMQQKEKEIASTPVGGIWHGQNLTWANNASAQWSSAAAGFWDDTPTLKSTNNKPSSVSKSNSTSAISAPKKKPQQDQQPKSSKTKVKKEDSVSTRSNTNGPLAGEFTDWCMSALNELNSPVDEMESAADVRDICRDYLGDGSATQEFIHDFLEKRRSYKTNVTAQKDDMCSPAPAITPSTQHSSDFQEVKGKGKKSKKSKMMKVDNRILGFSVTASRDRINVGARDYVNDL